MISPERSLPAMTKGSRPSSEKARSISLIPSRALLGEGPVSVVRGWGDGPFDVCAPFCERMPERVYASTSRKPERVYASRMTASV